MAFLLHVLPITSNVPLLPPSQQTHTHALLSIYLPSLSVSLFLSLPLFLPLSLSLSLLHLSLLPPLSLSLSLFFSLPFSLPALTSPPSADSLQTQASSARRATHTVKLRALKALRKASMPSVPEIKACWNSVKNKAKNAPKTTWYSYYS